MYIEAHLDHNRQDGMLGLLFSETVVIAGREIQAGTATVPPESVSGNLRLRYDLDFKATDYTNTESAEWRANRHGCY